MKNLQSFTISEVAVLFKLDRHTLYELIHVGELEAFRCGKAYRITQKAIEEFIANNKVA